MGGWGVDLAQRLNHVEHLNCSKVLADPEWQRWPAVLIDHVGELVCRPIHGLVELEINVPGMVGRFATVPVCRWEALIACAG